MMKISKNGASAPLGARRLARLRREYERRRLVRFPGLLDGGFLRLLQGRLEACRFREVSGFRFDRRLTADDPALATMMVMLFQDPILFRTVREVSGCGPIRKATGAIFRMLPGDRSSLDWHQDLMRGRSVAMCVNLSRRPFRGGTLQLRDRGAGKISTQTRYPRPGDAVMFRVSRGLFHRSTPVRGRRPKTILSLWFHCR